MSARTVLAFLATTFVQSAYSQCLGGGIATPLHAPCRNIAPARSYGCAIASNITAASALKAARGGSLGISTGSWVPPTGLSVASENVYEGPVTVVGNLPFMATVFLKGVFPTAGTGAVSYGCSNGTVGITAEGGGIDGISYAGLGHGGLRYNGLGFKGIGCKGYAGRIRGCGCGIY